MLNLKEKLSDCLNAFKLIIWRGFERIAWAKVRSCWSSSPLPRCPIRVTGARSCRSAPPCDGAAEAWGVGRCAELLAGASDVSDRRHPSGGRGGIPPQPKDESEPYHTEAKVERD